MSGQIPTVVFGATDSSGAGFSAVKVTMDGEVLTERLDGTALAAEPGEHTFVFETAGYRAVTRTLLIRQAEKSRWELDLLRDTDPDVSGRYLASPHRRVLRPEGRARDAEDPRDCGGWHRDRGARPRARAGLAAIAQKSDAERACPGSLCPTHDGSSKWSTASSTGNVATLGFVVGGVGVAAAAVLWLTAPSAPGTRLGLGPGGLQVRGAW